MAVQAVVFDVGETLVDETRAWAEWADWLDVPRLTLMAAIGAVIARGEPHQRAFEMVRPGIDLRAEVARRKAAGDVYHFSREDLYPDALPCLTALRAAGFRLAAAGNQPLDAEVILRGMRLPFEVVATSAGLGVAKPAVDFFLRLAQLLTLPPEAIVYVGDRLDNDVAPAARAGMLAVHLRRGPWGLIQSAAADARPAEITIDSLDQLPPLLAKVRS